MTGTFKDLMHELREKAIGDCCPYDKKECSKYEYGTDGCRCKSCVEDVCRRLEKAHEHELYEAKKAEFHRGWTDGCQHRETATWQLDRERWKAVQNLCDYDVDNDTHDTFARAIGVGQDECIRTRLIYLLGGDTDGRDSGHVCERPEFQTSTYDVLGNERHKAVCELRKLRERDVKVWNIEISIALGLDLDASNDDVCDRLIYLLGGDQPTLSDLYGILQDGAESESKGAESVSEMTKNAENGELDGDGTCPNGDGTCHNDGPTSSITDELRRWVRDLMPASGTLYIIGGATLDELYAVADRIDAKYDGLHAKLDDATAALDDELQAHLDKLTEKCDNQRVQLDTYNTMYDFDAIRRLKLERGSYKNRAECAEGKAKSTERKLAKAEGECLMYRAMLNDAADEFSLLVDEYHCCRDERDRYMQSILEGSVPATDENMAQSSASCEVMIGEGRVHRAWVD